MTLAEDHGLAGAPVLVEDLNAVGCGDEGQVRLLTSSWITSMCGDMVDFGDALVVGSGAALGSTASRGARRSRYPPRIRQKSSLGVPESSRANADDRLPGASLGRVEGGDSIVEGRD